MTNTLLTNPAKTPTQARAQRAMNMPRTIFTRVKRHYEEAMRAIWSAPDPETVLAQTGTKSAELLTRLDAAKTFLEGQQPGSTSAIVATVKPRTWTPNTDGTVSLAPIPAAK